MRKTLSAMVVGVSMGMTCSVFAQDIEKGLRAYMVKDYSAALKEFSFLADRGNAKSQYFLGIMFNGGLGVIKNYKEAISWFRKSAEQGDEEAQFYLGLMYASGSGILQDNIYAHMWYSISALNGDLLGSPSKDAISKKMTAAEIAKAQELARECVKRKYKGC